MENTEQITEDAVLLRHTELCVGETALNQTRFIEERLVPALAKAGFIAKEPRTAEGYTKWMATQRRYVSYMFKGERDIPMKYKWIWLSCLPEPYRAECKKELQALTGSLFVQMPQETDIRMPAVSRLHNVMREVSEMMRDSLPASDGSLSSDDDPKAVQQYANQIADVIEEAFAELLAIQQGTGIMPKRQIMALMMSDFEKDHDAGLEDNAS